MANHKSAKKRIRQTAKRNAANSYYHKTARNAAGEVFVAQNLCNRHKFPLVGSSAPFLWFNKLMWTPMGYPLPVLWFNIDMWTSMGYPRPVTCTPKRQRTDKDNLCTPSSTGTLASLRTGASWGLGRG